MMWLQSNVFDIAWLLGLGSPLRPAAKAGLLTKEPLRGILFGVRVCVLILLVALKATQIQTLAVGVSSALTTSKCFYKSPHNPNNIFNFAIMKSLLRTIICLVLALATTNLGHSRTVLSESTGEPIVYASIGVINRNLGTVADTLGNFSLKIPAEFVNDSIRISSIGYVAKTFAVKDIKNIADTIFLADDVMMLNEVVVKPQRIKHKIAGRKGAGGFLYIEVEGNKAAGQGLAIPLNVKERAWLKELGFTIMTENNPLSKMKFRVNIYFKDDDEYILQNFKPIYFDYDKSQLDNGLFTYVFPEEIMLDEGKYYIELEFLENFSNEFFIMRSKPMTGRTRYRYASQSDWETLPFGAPLYIEYDSVE